MDEFKTTFFERLSFLFNPTKLNKRLAAVYYEGQQKGFADGKESIMAAQKEGTETMTLKFKNFLVEEKEKLNKALLEYPFNRSKRLELIEIYQGKVLGMLYAFTEYDRSTALEVSETIQKNIRAQISLGPTEDIGIKQVTFVGGLLYTRYHPYHYDIQELVPQFIEENSDAFYDPNIPLNYKYPDTTLNLARRSTFDESPLTNLSPRHNAHDGVLPKTYSPDLVTVFNKNAGYGMHIDDDDLSK